MGKTHLGDGTKPVKAVIGVPESHEGLDVSPADYCAEAHRRDDGGGRLKVKVTADWAPLADTNDVVAAVEGVLRDVMSGERESSSQSGGKNPIPGFGRMVYGAALMRWSAPPAPESDDVLIAFPDKSHRAMLRPLMSQAMIDRQQSPKLATVVLHHEAWETILDLQDDFTGELVGRINDHLDRRDPQRRGKGIREVDEGYNKDGWPNAVVVSLHDEDYRLMWKYFGETVKTRDLGFFFLGHCDVCEQERALYPLAKVKNALLVHACGMGKRIAKSHLDAVLEDKDLSEAEREKFHDRLYELFRNQMPFVRGLEENPLEDES